MKLYRVLPLVWLIATPLALAAARTVTLSVPSMDCPVCPITVKKALEKVNGVQAVKVDFDSRTAIVTFDDTIASPTDLTKATANAGYPSTAREATK